MADSTVRISRKDANLLAKLYNYTGKPRKRLVHEAITQYAARHPSFLKQLNEEEKWGNNE